MARAKKKPQKPEKKPAPAKKARPRQAVLPGSDSDRHRDLEAQASRYVEARDIRMQCLDEEVKEKQALHELMNKYGLKQYRIVDTDPNLLVSVEAAEETVKVKRLSDKEATSRGPAAAVVVEEPDEEDEPAPTHANGSAVVED